MFQERFQIYREGEAEIPDLEVFDRRSLLERGTFLLLERSWNLLPVTRVVAVLGKYFQRKSVICCSSPLVTQHGCRVLRWCVSD